MSQRDTDQGSGVRRPPERDAATGRGRSWRSKLLAVASLSCLLPGLAAAADIKVSYRVDAKELKKSTPAGTSLLFQLYSDSTCASLVKSASANVETVSLIEQLKPIKVKQGPVQPSVAEVQYTLAGVTPEPAFYLKVTGTGIIPIGGTCQLQTASVGGTLPPAPLSCPADSVISGSLCVDKYEASLWDIPPAATTVIQHVKDGTATLAELTGAGATQVGCTGAPYSHAAIPGTFPANGAYIFPIYAASLPGILPSACVSAYQSIAACELSTKKLMSNTEWTAAAQDAEQRRRQRHDRLHHRHGRQPDQHRSALGLRFHPRHLRCRGQRLRVDRRLRRVAPGGYWNDGSGAGVYRPRPGPAGRPSASLREREDRTSGRGQSSLLGGATRAASQEPLRAADRVRQPEARLLGCAPRAQVAARGRRLRARPRAEPLGNAARPRSRDLRLARVSPLSHPRPRAARDPRRAVSRPGHPPRDLQRPRPARPPPPDRRYLRLHPRARHAPCGRAFPLVSASALAVRLDPCRPTSRATSRASTTLC